jgi:hypothetical protein
MLRPSKQRPNSENLRLVPRFTRCRRRRRRRELNDKALWLALQQWGVGVQYISCLVMRGVPGGRKTQPNQCFNFPSYIIKASPPRLHHA